MKHRPAAAALAAAALAALAITAAASAREHTAAAAPAAATPQLVYFGTRINGADGVIAAARFDPANGTLTALGTAAHVDRPTWVLPSPHRAVLYAVSETGNDGKTQAQVLSFRADPATGALTPISAVPSGGGGATFLALNGKAHALFVANYGTGQVAAVPLRPGGSLLPPGPVTTETGSGPSPRQKSAHAHGIAIDPTGRFALVTDLGADRIFVYRYDAATGRLSPAAAAAAKPGSGPRHAVFSRDGRFVYANSELSSELTTWAWDGAAAALRPLAAISTLRPDYAGENGAGEILLSRDGKYLYASNRGEDDIVVYALDAASGLPREIQRIASGGKSPWALGFDATGRWLLAANEASGTVTVLRHDPASGLLAATDKALDVPHASAIAMLPAGADAAAPRP